jgi:tetratricopeptide (TPR) repeat protein
MLMKFRGLASVLAVASLALTPVSAMAMGSSSSDDSSSTATAAPAPKPSEYKMGVAAVEAQNWEKAKTHMINAINLDPDNADAFNYLGYARRKSGDYDGAIKAYNAALGLDPDHKGAHEYIGQAYLEMGNVAKAEEHLDRLDSICTFGCAEYSSLKEAVAKAKGTS